MRHSASRVRLTALLGALSVYIFLFTSQVFHQTKVDETNEATGIRDLTEDDGVVYPLPDGKPLNILTLGGSVTWGAGVDDRFVAYPFRLRDKHGHKITNLAIRGTGSGYPAQCISTMLETQSDNDLSDYDPEVPFDVIVFEFSINGMHGFDLLLSRLRERFPDAFFIYVDVFSLMSPNGAFDSTHARKLVKEDGGEVYNFGNVGIPDENWNFREEIEDRKKPTDSIRVMFGDDMHHPSSLGHHIITAQIMEIVKKHDFPSEPRLGSWLGGDTCASWYEDGETFLTIHDGAMMKEWDEGKHKFAIEVSRKHGAILQYNHASDKEATVSFQHMTKATDRDDPSTSMYPPVIVTIEQNGYDIGLKKTAALNGEVELERENVNKVNKITEGWKYLSGLHRKIPMRTFHVTEVSNIGTLKPGRNFIYMRQVEERPNPFRLTAIIVCEACERLGWNDDLGW